MSSRFSIDSEESASEFETKCLLGTSSVDRNIIIAWLVDYY